MGRAKAAMMEAEEYSERTGLNSGLVRGVKFACADVTSEPHVRRFISQNGRQGECSYTHQKAIVVDYVDLAEWAVGKIKQYFRNPQDDGLYLESFFDDSEEDKRDPNSPFKYVDGFVTFRSAIHFEDTEELLMAYDFCDNAELMQDIADAIYNESWINIDSFAPHRNEELSIYWENFANQVKKAGGYTPSAFGSFIAAMRATGDRPFDLILSEIVNILSSSGCFTTIREGDRLYRCRNIDAKEDIKDYFKDMTSAPAEYAVANRMSRAGDSMFYAAFSKDVCLKEAVGGTKEWKALAEFKLKKDVVVVDLTNLPTPSLWADYDYEAIKFLHKFTKRVSENFDDYPADEKEIEYIPTQVLTDFIRGLIEPMTGQRVEGLKYYSSKVVGEDNVVLFCNQDDSVNYVDLVHCDFKEKTKKWDYTQMYNLHRESAEIQGIPSHFLDTTDTLYYDETDNVKTFRLKDGAFNNSAYAHFVLGGVEAKTSISFAELQALFHLQPNAKELKSALLGKDFATALGNKYLADFLLMIINKGWHLHFFALNIVYFALLDIVESLYKYFDHGRFHYYLKTFLYNVLIEDIEDLQELLTKYNFPDLQDNDIVPFCQDIMTRVALYMTEEGNERYAWMADMLNDALDAGMRSGELTFIQQEQKAILLKDLNGFYFEEVYKHPKATLVFDNENDVKNFLESHIAIVNGKEMHNYTMVDSKTEPLIQVSDMVVALISRYCKFVNREYGEVEADVNGFSDVQKDNLAMLNRLIKKSEDYNPTFTYYSISLQQKENIDRLKMMYC